MGRSMIPTVPGRASAHRLGLLVIVLAGCPEGPPVRSALALPEPSGAAEVPADAAGSHAPEAEPAPPSALARQMHERFATIGEIQQATIRGDLPRARRQAEDLAARLPAPDEPAPEPWRPHVETLRGELEGVVHGEDLRDVGASVARLALTCGRCHHDLAVETRLPPLPQLVQGPTLQDAMQGHRWAVDRMWEGIIGPSGDRWIRGSTLFIAIPGCTATTPATDEEGQALCTRAQSLARRGHVTESLEGRAAIYGRLLATCAGCHQRAQPVP